MSDHNLPIVNDSTAGRVETISKFGTIISAILASACCWLPLVLLMFGVSGAGIASTLEAWRPLFIVVTFGFLAAAFYFTYRPRFGINSGGEECCTSDEVKTKCCPPTSTRRFNMVTLNKIILWAVTVFAVVFLLFPSYVGTLFGTGNQTVTSDMQQAVFEIDGMTCDGCATTVQAAIRQVPGVLATDVDYEKSLAIVGMEPGQPIPVKDIRTSLEQAGYSGSRRESPSP